MALENENKTPYISNSSCDDYYEYNDDDDDESSITSKLMHKYTTF